MLNAYLRRLIFTALAVAATSVTECSEVPRPRGVSLSRASLYAAGRDFSCLDGSLTVPFIQVNDDYCDCADGSDEPGTSACPNGVFYCTNAGHKALSIPSSRVNDGICDCCDASDEYASTKCVNNCGELGRNARAEAQKKAELIKIGSQIRTEYGQKGALMKQERKQKLSALTKSQAELESLKEEKEHLKKEAERLESEALEVYRQIEEEQRAQQSGQDQLVDQQQAADAFARYDSNGDGWLDAAELQTRKAFDRDGDGQVDTEEAAFYLSGSGGRLDLDGFMAAAWPQVKPFAVLESGMFKPPEPQAPEGPRQPDDEDEDMEHEHEDEDTEQDPEREDDDGEQEHEQEQEQEEAERRPGYDEHTQRLVDAADEARAQLQAADKALQDVRRDIQDTGDFLQKDFGKDDEFLVLADQCFEHTDREYVYRLCPFGEVSQRPRAGGADTRLGTWSRWAGPEHAPYQAMLYDRGASCWNGPQRSTLVHVSCSTDNVLSAVAEPNRCEYVFEFGSPAACNPALIDRLNDEVHDEL